MRPRRRSTLARLFFAGRDRQSTFFVVQMMVVLSFCLATLLSLSGVWLPVGWMISMLPGPLCLGTARGLWRCDRMRRVIRVHRSREPYEVPCGGGALTKFPQLTAWRRGVRR